MVFVLRSAGRPAVECDPVNCCIISSNIAFHLQLEALICAVIMTQSAKQVLYLYV